MENKVNLSKKEDSINLSKVETTNKVTISNSSGDLDIKDESRLISVMAGVSIFAVIGFGFAMYNAMMNKYSNYDDVKSAEFIGGINEEIISEAVEENVTYSYKIVSYNLDTTRLALEEIIVPIKDSNKEGIDTYYRYGQVNDDGTIEIVYSKNTWVKFKCDVINVEDSYVEYTNDEVVIHCNSDFLDIVNIGTTQEH